METLDKISTIINNSISKRETLLKEINSNILEIEKIASFLEKNNITFPSEFYLGKERYPCMSYLDNSTWTNFLFISKTLTWSFFKTFKREYRVKFIDINNGFLYDPIYSVRSLNEDDVWKVTTFSLDKLDNEDLSNALYDTKQVLETLLKTVK